MELCCVARFTDNWNQVNILIEVSQMALLIDILLIMYHTGTS